MSFHIEHYEATPLWLKAKHGKIGGSSASAIIGKNPWVSNKEAYAELMGLSEPRNLDDNEAVQYGKEAEKHLRGLFALKHKELEVIDPPEKGFDLIINDERPYMCGTLDGTLIERSSGRKGVLEIKTADTTRLNAKETWREGIPINYLIQVLHYLAITDYEFAFLFAELKYVVVDEKTGYRDDRSTLRCYEIIATDEDKKELIKEEQAFYENYIKVKKEPPLILPNLYRRKWKNV